MVWDLDKEQLLSSIPLTSDYNISDYNISALPFNTVYSREMEKEDVLDGIWKNSFVEKLLLIMQEIRWAVDTLNMVTKLNNPQPYGGGYAAGWDRSSAQQTRGGDGGGYDYSGQQQSQQTKPPGGPGSTDTSTYGYSQQGQGYGQDGYYEQPGYGNPTSGYEVAGQTSEGNYWVWGSG
ncbi:hypothetical protein SSX86_018492 [Deinandra increscens subsp. villosa]|uniref:Uncharacterized protein n=1 Tax=Deinandra increscens subsp. villosa TaxID=3103831 RepID=A0AAP0CW23_9ASTR